MKLPCVSETEGEPPRVRDGAISTDQRESGAVPGAFPVCGTATEREDLAAPDGAISAVAGAVEGGDDGTARVQGKETVLGE